MEGGGESTVTIEGVEFGLRRIAGQEGPPFECYPRAETVERGSQPVVLNIFGPSSNAIAAAMGQDAECLNRWKRRGPWYFMAVCHRAWSRSA